MDMDKELKPLESLELIQRTIAEAKMRFQENGFVYIFWGALNTVCATAQFIMEELHVAYPFLIWLLTIPGAIYTSVYYARKGKTEGRNGNVISKLLMASGIIFGANIFVLGFGFWPYLGKAFVPVVVILLSLYAMIVGRALQFKQMFYIAVVTNILGFLLFYVDLHFQTLGLGLASIFLLLIPGVILRNMHKKN